MSRRKAVMILELVDRATKPARRFIALQKRMGRAVEMANRLSQRTYQAAQKASGLYTRAVRGLDRAQDALQKGLRRSNDLIRKQVTQMRTATGLMRAGVAGAGQAALLAGGLFTAYAGTVSAAGFAMLEPARQFEKFQTILTTTEGSAAAAQKAMGWVENFAVKTPYELEQVTGAFVQLRAYGLDPTNGMLKTLGDASAAMGKPLMQSVEAMADAVTGENERLKELGIKAAKIGKYFEYSYTGKDNTDKVVRALASDRQAIQGAILGIFTERYDGAMNLLSTTFDGMASNLSDIWTKFQRMIMASGVFDWMKGKLELVLQTLDAWDQDGRLEAYAKAAGEHIVTALEALWSLGTELVRSWQMVEPWLQRSADALGGWRNLALAVLAIPFRGVILGAAWSLVQLAGGAFLASRALGGIGFGVAMSGALGFGRALLALANPITWIKGAFLALRVALLASGVGALVVGLATAGVWVYNNWAGLAAFFKGFGAAFMKSLGPARPLAEGVIRVVSRLWDWIARLAGPLDASAEQWAAWGQVAGETVGNIVSGAMRMVGRIRSWFGRIGQINWREVFTLETAQTAWNNVARWIDGVGGRLWDGLTSIDWAALINLDGMKSAWKTVTDWVSGAGARLWDKLPEVPWRSKKEESPAVQARASGGAFGPGWLLTGEQGPELEYRTQGGYIAHNRALQRMLSMSRGITQNMVQPGAAMATGLVLSAAAPAAADGARYLSERNAAPHAPGPISINMTINGNVDKDVLPDLRAMKDEMLEELLERLEEAGHATTRREHR